MPVIDITKPETIKFLNECYEKTEKLRMRWIQIYAAEMQQAATLNKNKEKGLYEEDVIKASLSSSMPGITRDFITAGYNRRRKVVNDINLVQGIEALRKGHSILDIGLGDGKEDPRLTRLDTDLTPDPVMRPVNPEEKNIIYKNKPDYGRLEYLRRRHEKKPEDKFYFQECSMWEYGWRHKDYNLKGRSAFPRVWKLTKELRSRSGPQPDPPHYRSLDSEVIAAKCSI